MILRARLVVPLSQPPIRDGAIVVSRKRVVAVGRWRDLSRNASLPRLDMGEVALLPGLVNAHAHLDYTHMAGQFVPPKLFTDWLKLIMSTKAGWSYSDYAQSWLDGAQMLVRTGTTTVGDIEAIPELLPDVWTSTPLRVFSFLEMLGIRKNRRPAEILHEAVTRIDSLNTRRGRLGLSPHAPYSTLPELLRISAQAARKRRLLVCTHVAESALEFEMFTRGNGEMFHWLQRSQRDMSDCGLGSPVQHLERCGALRKNLLAVHVNYLARGDADLLGRREVSVVHCPRSHFYFGHDRFPLQRLTRAGVNICLGTDSLASVYKRRRETVELNIFEEMRALAKAEPSLSPRRIVEMATLNGAKALGMSGLIGELAPGSFADAIAIPAPAKPQNTYETMLHFRDNVLASMIDGRWALPPTS
jgi:cytosine/adenosine deaminase-related metal-dependent hydrolase